MFVKKALTRWGELKLCEFDKNWIVINISSNKTKLFESEVYCNIKKMYIHVQVYSRVGLKLRNAVGDVIVPR